MNTKNILVLTTILCVTALGVIIYYWNIQIEEEKNSWENAMLSNYIDLLNGETVYTFENASLAEFEKNVDQIYYKPHFDDFKEIAKNFEDNVMYIDNVTTNLFFISEKTDRLYVFNYGKKIG